MLEVHFHITILAELFKLLEISKKNSYVTFQYYVSNNLVKKDCRTILINWQRVEIYYSISSP